MKEVKQTYHEMVISIILSGILFATVGSIIAGNYLGSGEYIKFPLGVLAGCIVAVGLLSHMMKSISMIVELDEQTAKRYGAGQSFVRIFVMGLMICVACFYSDYINPWGVLTGMFTLKLSAHLQRPVHIFMKKYIRRGRRKAR